VSNMGNVRGPNGPLKPWRSGRGYLQIQVHDKNQRINRVVARAFVHNPCPDIFNMVDHIDQNKSNNCASNLRWLNNQLNMLNNSGRSIFKTPSGKWVVKIGFNKKNMDLGPTFRKRKRLR